MRKKILIGMMIVMILGVAVGGHFFARTSAQDPPKKADTEKGDDLFNALKQALESKKDGATIPPPVAPPPVNVQMPPPPVSSFGSDRVAPVLTKEPVASPPTGLPAIPPPQAVQAVQPSMPGGALTPDKSIGIPQTLQAAQAPLPPLAKPKPAREGDELPVMPPLPQAAPLTIPPTPPQVSVEPPTVSIAPNKIADDIAKVKDCPWTMNVELANGQTVVTATVNKTHEFKIVCQNLDLQTGKGTLMATGKVQISGDMMTGTCDSLAILLHEDCLILNGAAEVRIEKVAANVSGAKPTAFEMKGTKLILRISELTAGAFMQTNEPKIQFDVDVQKATFNMMTGDGKKWSPYGKLRSIKSSDNVSAATLCLEDNAGKVIAYLVAREGGSLDEFVGRTISVLGRREGENGGHPVLRVTHIAMP